MAKKENRSKHEKHENVKEKLKKGIVNETKSLVWGVFKETWDDILQIYVIGRIFGTDKEEEMANKGSGSTDERLSAFSRMFHSFSHDDEIRWNKMFTVVNRNDSKAERKFMKFMNYAVRRGYDEDTLRLRLIGSFSSQSDHDYAIDTIQSIVKMDGKYQQQIDFAKNRKLLVKKSFKNAVIWIGEHKLVSFLYLLSALMIFYGLLSWIFS